MLLLLANSLSPVMWRTLGLLFVGNLFIGVLEGLVIAVVFRFRVVRTVLLLIVANYCSMAVGAGLFGTGEGRRPIPEALFEAPIHYAGTLLWTCLAISFAMSVIVEWPFCRVAARGVNAPMRRSWLAAILAQCVSYPLLILLFSDSTNTIGEAVIISPLSDVVPDDLDASVYFIGNDGAIYSIHVDGSTLARIQSVAPTDHHAVLVWSASDDDDEHTTQLILSRSDGEEIIDQVVGGTCSTFRSGMTGTIVRESWWLGFKGIADLRPLDERALECTPHGNSGIEFSTESGASAWITYDTPFISWWGRSITILPGDIAVFELGRQVCVLSMRSRRIAFLARGQGPVVHLHARGTLDVD